MKDTIQVEN